MYGLFDYFTGIVRRMTRKSSKLVFDFCLMVSVTTCCLLIPKVSMLSFIVYITSNVCYSAVLASELDQH